MKGSKPSPKDSTQVRIAKDKREFDRLVKAAQMELVEGHSPVVYDYLNYWLDRIEDPVKDAERTVDDILEVDMLDMSTYFTEAEEAALETVDLWGAEYQQTLKDAEERNFAWVGNVETQTMEYIYRGDGIASDGYIGYKETAEDKVKKGEDVILTIIDDEEDKAKDDLEKAEQEGPGFWGNLWDATVGLPEVLVNIGKLIDTFVNLDLDKYVNDNVELAKAHKRLQERLSEEGV